MTGQLAEVAPAAEYGGLDTLWMADHPSRADPSSTWDEYQPARSSV